MALKVVDEFILAAILARLNMGQSYPKASQIGAIHRAAHVSADSCVDALCGEFMETEKHEKVFYKEAAKFLTDIRKKNGEQRHAPVVKWYRETCNVA